MDRTERIAVLHRLLSTHRLGVSQAQLMRETGCSRSALYRDLGFLRDHLGAPLVREGDPVRLWRYSGEAAGTFQLPGMWMNADELYALLLSRQVLARSGEGVFNQALGPLQPRIHALLGERAFRLDRLHVLRTQARQGDPSVFRLVTEAVLSARQLHFSYRARSSDRASLRRVSPQRLIHHRDNWYLDAWDAGRETLRRFALDRINDPALSTERAIDVPAEQLDAHFDAGYGIFAGADVGTAVIHFSAHAARWVADEHWHAKQRMRHLKGGGLELTLPYSNPRELLMDILRYADEAEILAPETLRSEMQTLLSRAARRYAAE